MVWKQEQSRTGRLGTGCRRRQDRTIERSTTFGLLPVQVGPLGPYAVNRSVDEKTKWVRKSQVEWGHEWRVEEEVFGCTTIETFDVSAKCSRRRHHSGERVANKQ